MWNFFRRLLPLFLWIRFPWGISFVSCTILVKLLLYYLFSFFLRIFSVITAVGKHSNKLTELNYCYYLYPQDHVWLLFDFLHSLIVVYCKYKYSTVYHIIF
jgi:hypothetical protein